MKKVVFKLVKYIGLFLFALLMYGIVVTLLSFIPVNSYDSRTLIPAQKIEIYLLTNGVHTDIVLPVKNEYFDWSKQVKYIDTKAKDSTAQFMAIGWGDKGFYLETPTWADLKASTALKAATGLSSSALHVTFYKNMKEGVDCKKITIDSNEYKKLIVFINDSFQLNNDNVTKINTEAVYGENDAFYEAKGSYSLFYTCNTWANQALKAANQKAALWTITDSGIFRHYKN
ncbi:TIGR02117 family protein [Flavobacterium sp.]|uniref:TIGR02117 family protein n=1 Tax=Flavobacterium sp. TaxID=239 RepID=UPI0035B30BFE